MERKTLETLKRNIKEEQEIHQKAGVGYTPLIPALGDRGRRGSVSSKPGQSELHLQTLSVGAVIINGKNRQTRRGDAYPQSQHWGS